MPKEGHVEILNIRSGLKEEYPHEDAAAFIASGTHDFVGDGDEDVPVLVDSEDEYGVVTTVPHTFKKHNAAEAISTSSGRARWITPKEHRYWEDKATYGNNAAGAAALGLLDAASFRIGGRLLDEIGVPVNETREHNMGAHLGTEVAGSLLMAMLPLPGTKARAATTVATNMSRLRRLASITAPGRASLIGRRVQTSAFSKLAHPSMLGPLKHGPMTAAEIAAMDRAGRLTKWARGLQLTQDSGKAKKVLYGTGSRLAGVIPEAMLIGGGYGISEADFGDPMKAVEHITTVTGHTIGLGVGIVGLMGLAPPLAVGSLAFAGGGMKKGLLWITDSKPVQLINDALVNMGTRGVGHPLQDIQRLHARTGEIGRQARASSKKTLETIDSDIVTDDFLWGATDNVPSSTDLRAVKATEDATKPTSWLDRIRNMAWRIYEDHGYLKTFSQSSHSHSFIQKNLKGTAEAADNIITEAPETVHLIDRLLYPFRHTDAQGKETIVEGFLPNLRDEIIRPLARADVVVSAPYRTADTFSTSLDKWADKAEGEQIYRWVLKLDELVTQTQERLVRLSRSNMVRPMDNAQIHGIPWRNQVFTGGRKVGFMDDLTSNQQFLAEFKRHNLNYLDKKFQSNIYKELEELLISVHKKETTMTNPSDDFVRAMDVLKKRTTDFLTETGEFGTNHMRQIRSIRTGETHLIRQSSLWGAMSLRKKELNTLLFEHNALQAEFAERFMREAADGTLVPANRSIMRYLELIRNPREIETAQRETLRLAQARVQLTRAFQHRLDLPKSQLQIPLDDILDDVVSAVASGSVIPTAGQIATRFNIGANRAQTIIKQMEHKGYISPIMTRGEVIKSLGRKKVQTGFTARGKPIWQWKWQRPNPAQGEGVEIVAGQYRNIPVKKHGAQWKDETVLTKREYINLQRRILPRDVFEQRRASFDALPANWTYKKLRHAGSYKPLRGDAAKEFENPLRSVQRRAIADRDNIENIVADMNEHLYPAMRYRDIVSRDYSTSELFKLSGGPILAGGLMGIPGGPVAIAAGITGGAAFSAGADIMMSPMRHAARLSIIEDLLSAGKNGFDTLINGFFNRYARAGYRVKKGALFPRQDVWDPLTGTMVSKIMKRSMDEGLSKTARVMRYPRFLTLNAVGHYVANKEGQPKPDLPNKGEASLEEIRTAKLVIKSLAEDPELLSRVVASSYGELEQHAPELTNALASKATNFVTNMYKDMPKEKFMGIGQDPLPASESEDRAWFDSFKMGEFGLSLMLEKIDEGYVSDGELEAWQREFPEQFKQFTLQVLERYTSDKEWRDALPYRVKLALEKIIPGLGADDSRLVTRLRDSYKPKEKPKGGGGGQPSYSDNRVNMASSGMEGVLRNRST